MRTIFGGSLLFLLVHAGFAQSQDAKGCQDSPLVSRFPGSVIVQCSHKDDETFTFTLAKGVQKSIEGDHREIIYAFPATASGPQVRRNFATALRSAGYTFERDPADNRRGNLVAHMGKTWIDIQFNDEGSRMWENILVEIQLKQEVAATAAALGNGLAGQGHVVVNGILFDTAKADVKPESAPAPGSRQAFAAGPQTEGLCRRSHR